MRNGNENLVADKDEVEVVKKFAQRFRKLKIDFIKQNYVHNNIELGEAMGVSSASISRWETGKQIPNIIYLYKIAKFFGVTADYLIGLTDN